jgi:endonuclease/exonuclease/phosphatase family metal-dependent hydrolase
MRDQFTVATFNLLNFIDADRPYYEREIYSLSQYNAKCDWLADQFDRIDADVIAVQECWSEPALGDAVRRSKKMHGAGTVSVPFAEAGSDLPRVGLISRLPLLEPIKSFTQIAPQLQQNLPSPVNGEALVPTRRHTHFSRPVLKSVINLAPAGAAPLALHLFNLHLKSKRPEAFAKVSTDSTMHEDLDEPRTQALANFRSLLMRGAEAAAVRLLVLDSLVNSGTPVIVTGDFNDSADAVTTEMIAGRAGMHDRAARDYLLYNAANLEYRYKLHRQVGYTHIHQGDPDTIDHFLLSEEFMPQSKRCLYQLQRLDYFNDHLNNLRLGNNSPGPRDQTESDHGIVRARFVRNER